MSIFSQIFRTRMHCRCDNNRIPRKTFMDHWKPQVRPCRYRGELHISGVAVQPIVKMKVDKNYLRQFHSTSKVLFRQKGGDLTQSYDKSPYTHGNVKRAKWQHKQRHKKFDYTAVADRLRTVSWSNWCGLPGLQGPTFPLTATAV